MPLSQSLRRVGQRVARLRRWLARRVLLPDLAGEQAHDLRGVIRLEGALTPGYVLMSALSAGIATLGLLQSSPAVVIGAMLVSPLMSPIASLGFGFASFDGKWIREAARVVIVGAAIGIAMGLLLTWLSPIDNATPEIIARTQPTLLDLGVALLSGVAGGYASVYQRGGAAIGVAIATALMPPLATIGYGLGVLRLDFAAGAMLLFLTNLAAIAFAFALIARLSGVARPIDKVEMAPRFIAAGLAAFLLLATPLGMTLFRVVEENEARAAVERVLYDELDAADSSIAQLDVAWPLFGELTVDAVVIAPVFRGGAQRLIADRIERELGAVPRLNLQQVVAADVGSQARAIVDAALDRNAAGIARDVPPLGAIRSALGVPVQALWVDRPARVVHIVPVAADGWSLGDYRLAEVEAAAHGGEWRVEVAPPAAMRLLLPFPGNSAELDETARRQLADFVWALGRWAVTRVAVIGAPTSEGDDQAALAAQRLDIAARALIGGGIDPVAVDAEVAAPNTLELRALIPPPSRPTAPVRSTDSAARQPPGPAR